MNRDFYEKLPSEVCELLDDKIIPKFQNEVWFTKAWEEYRQHILGCESLEEQRMPGFIFKKYIID